MNYNEIKEKYPKAFDALVVWLPFDEYEKWVITPEGVLCRGYYEDYESFYSRDLYDFFDEKGVMVEIACRYYSNEMKCRVFDGNIYDGRLRLESDLLSFPTRREAESAAFVKAFEILEGRI